ncbi:MAG: hypothetical protein ACK4Z0_00800 [Sphingomonadaceae bacterium]
MKRLLMAAAAATLLLGVTPAAVAQDVFPYRDGNYWFVTGIHVKDGSALTYANHLARVWQVQMDYAKSKGWMTGYHILTNENPRQDEPDLYLVTITDRMVGADEAEKRGQEMRAYMKKTMQQMEAESGQRADYRTVGSNMLLREQIRR